MSNERGTPSNVDRSEKPEVAPRGPRPGQGGKLAFGEFNPDRIRGKLQGSAYASEPALTRPSTPSEPPPAVEAPPSGRAQPHHPIDPTSQEPSAELREVARPMTPAPGDPALRAEPKEAEAPRRGPHVDAVLESAEADFIGATNLGITIPERVHIAAKAKATSLGVFEFKYAIWGILDGFAKLDNPALDAHVTEYVRRYKEWERSQGRGRRARRARPGGK